MNWIATALKRSFDYSGRSRRMEYWSFALFSFVILIVAGVVDKQLGFAVERPTGGVEGGLILPIAFFILLIPGLAVSVRRLHDANFVGWWTVLPVAPIIFLSIAIAGGFSSEGLFRLFVVAIMVAPLILLALMCVPGTAGPNRFGDDPKGRSQNLGDTFA